MATQFLPDQLELDERQARLREIIVNSEKLQLEGQKLSFERNKLDAERLKMDAERLKMDAERSKIDRETGIITWVTIFQAMLATAALIGAGAAIAKIFFS